MPVIMRPTKSDAEGRCLSCGRDNTGYEDAVCSDECPAYWEEMGIPHPDHPPSPHGDST